MRNAGEAKRPLSLRILKGAKVNSARSDRLEMEKAFKKYGVEYPTMTRHSNLRNNVK